MPSRRVVLLEFNELSPEPMQRFMAEGKLPSFSRFYHQAQVFTTDAEAVAPDLEPWIQWITVHTGLSHGAHDVRILGDAHALSDKAVWDVVSDHGGKVWLCGSMNLQYQSPIRGWVLPDPWMTKVAPQPADELAPYTRFVSAYVIGRSLDHVPLRARQKLEFVRFMAHHGLSAETLKALVTQLLIERTQPGARWKRAVLLDRLQFDLFRWVYRRERPDFSTFFSNSTAHFQHLYWRNMQPDAFHVKPSRDEQVIYEKAILYGYQQMDKLLGRFLEFVGDDTTLVFCTALSQQPCVTYEQAGGKRWYRPRHFEVLLSTSGVAGPYRIAPIMAHEFCIDFDSEAEARRAEAQLRLVRTADDKPVLIVERTGTQIRAACYLSGELPADTSLRLAGVDRPIPFFDLFYRVDGLKSGMHHPDGMLWIRTPDRRHNVEPIKVSLIDVAPTLLAMLGVAKPSHMVGKAILEASSSDAG